MAEQWQNAIHVGNCIEGLNKQPEGGVDLAFADPPYNIGYSYDVYRDNLENQEYLGWTRSWLLAVHRSLKPSGALWLAIGDEYVADIKRIADDVGFHLRNWVIWYYTFGVHCTKKFSRSHTHLLYFVKNAKVFTFNDADIRVPSARQLVYDDSRADSRGRVPDNTWILRPQDAADGFRPEHDTWYFARIAGTFKERAGFHSCQMPERLLERVIRSCSKQDEVVLDPFAGSGSTLIVAKKLGRKWVGYDVSPDYVRQARARVDAVRAGDPIEGPEDALTSAPSTRVFRSFHQAVNIENIICAYRKASDGYSADRVIADPVRNAAFLEECNKLGMPGRPQDWNMALLGLRKKGGKIYTAKTTQVNWSSLDPFQFASEIALVQMLKLHYTSLDDVLCDPVAAIKFDDIARSLAPGFSSFQYRWAAFRLRKDARLWRKSSRNFKKVPGFSATLPLDQLASGKAREIPAVYLLMPRGGDKPVYIGETKNFADRAKRTYETRSVLDRFVPSSGEWEFRFIELEGSDAEQRWGIQSKLIGREQPVMNYAELAEVA